MKTGFLSETLVKRSLEGRERRRGLSLPLNTKIKQMALNTLFLDINNSTSTAKLLLAQTGEISPRSKAKDTINKNTRY